MTTVTLLRDFAEDGRISMDRYADQLARWLGSGQIELGDSPLHLVEYQPSLSSWARRLPETANLRMRLARYLDYPRQAAKLEGDILHIVDHGYAHLIGKLDPAKVVVTVHDLIPVLAGRGLLPGVAHMRRNWLSEYSTSFLKKACKIIAVSHNTRNDLLEHCGCRDEQVTVIHNYVDPVFRPLPEEERAATRQVLGLPGTPEKLVLVTGQDYYKNLETSLQVMQRLEKSIGDVRLVRLGRDNAYWRSLCETYPLKKDPISICGLSAERLNNLYNTVNCLLFPSWYEGFGWPPLEAMACGTPVVASNRASLPEVLGEDAQLFEPDDEKGMAAAIESLLGDKDKRASCIERGLEQAARFSAQEHLQQVFKVYESFEKEYQSIEAA